MYLVSMLAFWAFVLDLHACSFVFVAYFLSFFVAFIPSDCGFRALSLLIFYLSYSLFWCTFYYCFGFIIV